MWWCPKMLPSCGGPAAECGGGGSGGMAAAAAAAAMAGCMPTGNPQGLIPSSADTPDREAGVGKVGREPKTRGGGEKP